MVAEEVQVMEELPIHQINSRLNKFFKVEVDFLNIIMFNKSQIIINLMSLEELVMLLNLEILLVLNQVQQHFNLM